MGNANPEEFRPKAGSVLEVSVINLNKDEVLQHSEVEVVDGGGGDLTAKLRGQKGAPEMAAAFSGRALPQTKSKGKGGSPELEAAKLAWEIIKDNKPVAEATGASTSVLYHGTDPMDYEGARSFESDTFQYRIRDSIIKDWVLVSADIRLEGTYHARPTRDGIPDGLFLPSVSFRVLNMNVPWTFKLSANASVAPPANVGTGGVIQPRVRIYANLQTDWLFQSMPSTISFEADGKLGGVLGTFAGSGNRIVTR